MEQETPRDIRSQLREWANRGPKPYQRWMLIIFLIVAPIELGIIKLTAPFFGDKHAQALIVVPGSILLALVIVHLFQIAPWSPKRVKRWHLFGLLTGVLIFVLIKVLS